MVAAFDEVRRLTKDDRGLYLPLRFSHVQLKYAIDGVGKQLSALSTASYTSAQCSQ
jgi:hypothetical protein